MMKIAVSACLLGEKVRFDSGHKRDSFVTEELARYASYVSFCPENIAFGNPRPSIRLVKNSANEIEVLSNKDATDLTPPLLATCKSELESIQKEPLCGIIFKSKSPSCGMGSAKLYLENGFCESTKEDGVFAALCKQNFTFLPMEEEGRLQDAWLRENFVMQLFAYADLERFIPSCSSFGELVAFHTSYKFLLYSKNELLYRALGNIVANHEKYSLERVLELYRAKFQEAIAHKSTIRKSRSVLEHMAGFLKRHLSSVEKEMLHTQIEDFASRFIPIIVPLLTLELFAKKYEVAYLMNQKYLSPYPKELALRSDIKSGK